MYLSQKIFERFLNKGHSLFVENYYFSPVLFEYLHRYKTGAYGTVQKNRAGLPIFEEIEEHGEQVFYQTNNLLALQCGPLSMNQLWFQLEKFTL